MRQLPSARADRRQRCWSRFSQANRTTDDRASGFTSSRFDDNADRPGRSLRRARRGDRSRRAGRGVTRGSTERPLGKRFRAPPRRWQRPASSRRGSTRSCCSARPPAGSGRRSPPSPSARSRRRGARVRGDRPAPSAPRAARLHNRPQGVPPDRARRRPAGADSAARDRAAGRGRARAGARTRARVGTGSGAVALASPTSCPKPR